MQSTKLFATAFVILCAAACGGTETTNVAVNGQSTLRVVNAFVTPVDVLVDGKVSASGVAAGAVTTAAVATGSHTVEFRSSSGGSSTQVLTAAEGAMPTFAVVRASSGSVSSVALDDTNSVVPSGATKVRVLHMAPNAGTLQVYRTQPDYQTPISWQFPFTYQATPNSLSAPFYQSTPGTWEIHVWQSSSDNWSTAPVKVTIPLASGEKKTVVILDNPGGGVKVQLL